MLGVQFSQRSNHPIFFNSLSDVLLQRRDHVQIVPRGVTTYYWCRQIVIALERTTNTKSTVIALSHTCFVVPSAEGCVVVTFRPGLFSLLGPVIRVRSLVSIVVDSKNPVDCS